MICHFEFERRTFINSMNNVLQNRILPNQKKERHFDCGHQ